MKQSLDKDKAIVKAYRTFVRGIKSDLNDYSGTQAFYMITLGRLDALKQTLYKIKRGGK